MSILNVGLKINKSNCVSCFLGKGIHRPLFYIYRRVLRMYNPENHLGRYKILNFDM